MAAAAVALGLTGTFAWPMSEASAASSYEALARAVGIDGTFTNPSVPLGFVFEGIGPQADARQTSLGTGDANAAFPYIGDVAPGLPGAFGGIVGLPVPPYPLLASSNRGSERSTVSYPGVTLQAESNDSNTIGNAVAGQDAAGLTALARVDELNDGSVTALADTAANVLRLGGVVTLSGYRSHAEATADGTTGALRRSSSISFARISIPGLSLDIPKTTPGTVPLPIPIPGVPNVPPLTFPPVPLAFGGSKIAAPDIGFVDGVFTLTVPFAGETQTYAVPAQNVLDAFKASGVEMVYQAPQETAAGIVAAGFTFKFLAPGPPSNPYFAGNTPMTFSSGLTLAQVSLHPIQQPSFGVTGPSATGTASGAAGTDAVFGPVGSPVDGIGVLDSAVAAPASTPLYVGGGARDGGAQFATSAGYAGGLHTRDVSNIYLVFVAVAMVAFLAATALRLMGVRLRWVS